jgi:hypothetical protein
LATIASEESCRVMAVNKQELYFQFCLFVMMNYKKFIVDKNNRIIGGRELMDPDMTVDGKKVLDPLYWGRPIPRGVK